MARDAVCGERQRLAASEAIASALRIRSEESLARRKGQYHCHRGRKMGGDQSGGCAIATASTEGYASLDYVLALAREQLRSQIEQQQALISRSSQLLGFTGVVLALLANSDYLARHWHASSTAGVVLLFVAALLFLVSLFVRVYKQVGDAKVLEKEFVDKPETYTKRVVLRATTKATTNNKRVLSQIAFCVKLGSLCLMTGVLLIGIGTVLMMAG
jgi:hypothetical protein